MANVIFRYSVTPSYGCCGDSDGGFSLTLTDGGDVEYMEYKFCKITESCRHFDLSPNAAAEIVSFPKIMPALMTFRTSLKTAALTGIYLISLSALVNTVGLISA